MACQNCFNGCAEIVSDRCVRYTGINIPSLGITTGDSLADIEQSLTEFLLSVMAGTGIHPVIDPDIICNLVGKYLPVCGDLTVVDFITALIKASCDLQEQVIVLDEAVAAIEADYNVGTCLTGVVASSGTHDILQAVIVALCQTNVNLTALTSTVTNLFNYNNPELDAYLAQYLIDHTTGTTLVSAKMIAYVAYPYFNTDLSNFNLSGAGIGDWINVNLCNGANGTPDMRGRVPVASTSMGNPAITDPSVLPGGFNPSYIVAGPLYGANSVLLNSTTVPNHTHTATATASQAPHSHYEFATDSYGGTSAKALPSTYVTVSKLWGDTSSYELEGNTVTPSIGMTDIVTPAITVNTVTVASTAGGGNAHANIQPVIACYYIMYVP